MSAVVALATYNAPHRLRHRNLPRDFQRLADSGVSLIAGQENADADARRNCPRGWEFYRPGVARSAVLFWDPRVWEALGPRGAFRVHLGKKSAPRYIVWADLRHRETGIVRRFGSVHLAAFKTRGGAYAEEFRHQERKAAEWLAASPDRVLLGDLNASPGGKWTRRLERVGTFQHPIRRTRGIQKIDHVLVPKGQPRAHSARTVKGGSDHRALIVALPLTGSPRPPKPPKEEDPMAPWAYPKADRTAQWYHGRYAARRFSRIEKIVFHSTETTSWPGYGGGASAPNLTYNPRTREWRQHFRLDESSRALENRYGGVETNSDNVVQVEIIGYSDRSLAARVGGLPIRDLPKHALEDLGEFVAFMHKGHGVPIVTVSQNWSGFRYGTGAWQRMSGPAFDVFRGVLAHAHVPENSHWDPDSLNIAAVLTHARALAEPKPLDPQDKDVDPDDTDKDTDKSMWTERRTVGKKSGLYVATDGKRSAWSLLVNAASWAKRNTEETRRVNARLAAMEKTLSEILAEVRADG